MDKIKIEKPADWFDKILPEKVANNPDKTGGFNGTFSFNLLGDNGGNWAVTLQNKQCQIKKETILFEGNVKEAVKCFPQNINVAATIALASGTKDKLKIRIATSPEYKVNSHEIEMVGEFGRLVTKTENVVCPDNPKTSYLAVLSAVQTLKQYFEGVKIGT